MAGERHGNGMLCVNRPLEKFWDVWGRSGLVTAWLLYRVMMMMMMQPGLCISINTVAFISPQRSPPQLWLVCVIGVWAHLFAFTGINVIQCLWSVSVSEIGGICSSVVKILWSTSWIRMPNSLTDNVFSGLGSSSNFLCHVGSTPAGKLLWCSLI